MRKGLSSEAFERSFSWPDYSSIKRSAADFPRDPLAAGPEPSLIHSRSPNVQSIRAHRKNRPEHEPSASFFERRNFRRCRRISRSLQVRQPSLPGARRLGSARIPIESHRRGGRRPCGLWELGRVARDPRIVVDRHTAEHHAPSHRASDSVGGQKRMDATRRRG